MSLFNRIASLTDCKYSELTRGHSQVAHDSSLPSRQWSRILVRRHDRPSGLLRIPQSANYIFIRNESGAMHRHLNDSPSPPQGCRAEEEHAVNMHFAPSTVHYSESHWALTYQNNRKLTTGGDDR